MKKTFILLCCMILMSGCTKGPTTSHTIKNVKRVMMHETNYYTIFYQDEHMSRHLLLSQSFYFCAYNQEGLIKPDIVMDVPDNEDMWVEYKEYEYDNQTFYPEFTIHIHSPKKLEGGGWNHGKFGSGQTNVLE